MEIEGVLQLKGYIQDFAIWDDIINLLALKFHEKYNIYPNILLASEETYNKIDLYAQMHPERLIAPDDETILTSNESYTGISEFVTENYVLDCCFDYDLAEGNITLIYDEAPDFSGETEPVVEEDKGKIYQFKKSA